MLTESSPFINLEDCSVSSSGCVECFCSVFGLGLLLVEDFFCEAMLESESFFLSKITVSMLQFTLLP